MPLKVSSTESEIWTIPVEVSSQGYSGRAGLQHRMSSAALASASECINQGELKMIRSWGAFCQPYRQLMEIFYAALLRHEARSNNLFIVIEKRCQSQSSLSSPAWSSSVTSLAAFCRQQIETAIHFRKSDVAQVACTATTRALQFFTWDRRLRGEKLGYQFYNSTCLFCDETFT